MTNKVREILETASVECEGANYHDRCGMAESLFEAIENWVPKNNHERVATAIAEAVQKGI